MTESGDLIQHDLVSDETTVLDEDIFELQGAFTNPPPSPEMVYYTKADGDRVALWSTTLQ